MAQVNKSVTKERLRDFDVTAHAIERLQEYGTDIARAAPPIDLHNILCEQLNEAFRLAAPHVYEYRDDQNRLCYLTPFQNEFWAEPGLTLLTYPNDSANQRKQIRTVLTAATVAKSMFTPTAHPKLVPPALELPKLTPIVEPASSEFMLLERKADQLLPLAAGTEESLREAILGALMRGVTPQSLVVYRKHGEIKINIQIG